MREVPSSTGMPCLSQASAGATYAAALALALRDIHGMRVWTLSDKVAPSIRSGHWQLDGNHQSNTMMSCQTAAVPAVLRASEGVSHSVWGGGI
jgi:hypothetical protein